MHIYINRYSDIELVIINSFVFIDSHNKNKTLCLLLMEIEMVILMLLKWLMQMNFVLLMQTEMVLSTSPNFLVLKVIINKFNLVLQNLFSFDLIDPVKFGAYDTNHDGLVDSPEYARGEYLIEHRCKYINHLIYFQMNSFVL
jgi:hypothetical protein